MQVQGWMNVYRSGHFHRQGKPKAFDRHAGDLYASYEDAIRDIDPPTHYVATVPVVWDDPEPIAPNPENSEPVPLSLTRKRKPINATV